MNSLLANTLGDKTQKDRMTYLKTIEKLRTDIDSHRKNRSVEPDIHMPKIKNVWQTQGEVSGAKPVIYEARK